MGEEIPNQARLPDGQVWNDKIKEFYMCEILTFN